MLISMLMTGSTDSAIANTLNINVRSVRRWISDLMDELGVSTRLQLGAALVRSDGLRGRARLVGLDRDHAVMPLHSKMSTSRRHAQSHARGPKRTAGVAQGEELRAEPRGKVPHGLCWSSHAHSQLDHRERQVSRLPCGRSCARLPTPNTIRLLARFHYPVNRDMSRRRISAIGNERPSLSN